MENNKGVNVYLALFSHHHYAQIKPLYQNVELHAQ